MTARGDALDAMLKRHGIDDADAYLDERGDQAEIARTDHPDVQMRGSVQLMKDREISRDEVEEGFKRLKYL